MSERHSMIRQTGRSVRYKILLVDDDVTVLRSLAAALEFDFDVVSCQSAERALSLLKTEPFHAVCSDYSMPGMNGLELFERVSQLAEPVGCLLLTGASSFIARQTSAEHYVLTKPVDPARLSGLLARLAQNVQLKRHAVRERAAR